ncbi:ABC transporter permease [Marichromatium gracile]|uniref:ABC transporter permease n=1 Tax=Marichromatium gracile TaxID=1048 RepID=UPI001F1DEDF8|nr:ABC transporter permease [Marichromatium gracile]MCF1184988.1 ABC transporter permease [Marichromatium gracile]
MHRRYGAVLVIPLLARISLRQLSRQPWQSALAVLGIALGVAVVVAVGLANDSARRAIALSVEQLDGRASHRIESSGTGIADAEAARLLRALAPYPATPVIEQPLRLEGEGLTLLGIDLLQADALRGDALAAEALPDPARLAALLTEPGALLLGATDARRLGAVPGDRLSVRHGGHTRQARLVGVIAQGLDGLALADLGSAQWLAGRDGVVDRIDLVLPPEAAAGVAAALPPGLRLEASAQRGAALHEMTRAFRINLLAMSLIALLVGGFIVYSTQTFTVVRRRALFGTLRALGATRARIAALVLAETLALALVGALLGIALGILAGRGLVQLVARTIDDLYFRLEVSTLALDPATLLLGAGLALGVALVAALAPALEAAGVAPREAMRAQGLERRAQGWTAPLARLGAALALTGWLASLLPGESLAQGFALLLMVVLGLVLCVPALLRGAAAALAGLGARLGAPLALVLAARTVAGSVARTGIAAAALALAVATSVGVGVMIESFRHGVIDWLDHTLEGELYVTADSREAPLPPGLDEALVATDGVASVIRARRMTVTTREGEATLLVRDRPTPEATGPLLLARLDGDPWAAGRILVSEPYAHHHRLAPGDRIELATPDGWRRFSVGAVFRDYGSDRGLLMLPYREARAHWEGIGIGSLALRLAPDGDPQRVRERVQALAESHDRTLLLTASGEIRTLTLEIFDRTFAITEVLRLLALAVAFVGVLSALLALQLERRRTHALLRATGMSGRALALTLLAQGSILGLVAGLLAIPLGLVMGELLIRIINVRAFGWSMALQIPPLALLSGPLLAWCAALAAALPPALRAGREPPARGLRGD